MPGEADVAKLFPNRFMRAALRFQRLGLFFDSLDQRMNHQPRVVLPALVGARIDLSNVNFLPIRRRSSRSAATRSAPVDVTGGGGGGGGLILGDDIAEES